MISETKISSRDQSSKPSKRAVIPFFLLTFTISWACFIPVALNSQGLITLPFPSEILLLLGVFGPTVSAFILTWRISNRIGIWRLLRRGFDPRFPPSVYGFIILIPLLTTLIGYFLTGGREPNLDILSIASSAVLYFFLGGSFGEEFGWRGFALPRLLEFRNILLASLILGAFWALWHLPLFWIVGTSQFLTPFWLFAIYVVSLAVQHTWVYLRSGGSIFACLLFHTFTNLNVVIFPIQLTDGSDNRIYYETALNLAVSVIIIVRQGWIKKSKRGLLPFSE